MYEPAQCNHNKREINKLKAKIEIIQKKEGVGVDESQARSTNHHGREDVRNRGNLSSWILSLDSSGINS